MGPEGEAGFILAITLLAEMCRKAQEQFSQRESEDIELIPLD